MCGDSKSVLKNSRKLILKRELRGGLGKAQRGGWGGNRTQRRISTRLRSSDLR